MKVALDVSSLDSPHLSGVGTYIRQLYFALSTVHEGPWLKPVVRAGRWKKRKHIRSHLDRTPALFFLGRVWQSGLDFDLWHGPDFKLPGGLKQKKIVTIHDIAFYESGMTDPAFARKRIDLLEHTLLRQNPEGIITVSEFTRRKLLERFPQFEDRTRAIPLAADHLHFETPPAEEKISASPYFLFVGNLEARKNLLGLLKAFEAFAQREKEFRLVLVGKPGFGWSEIKPYLEFMKSADRVELKGYLSQQELSRLYRQACAFVYPSLHEGFGIPVLEAMLQGCPVLTSNQTATAEVAGPAALLVDPRNHDQLVQGLQQLVSPDFRRQLKELGGRRAEVFSWKKTAESTFQFYSEVASGSLH